MKIAWIAKHTIKEIPTGGAELTDSYWIQQGRKEGYDIDTYTPQDNIYTSKYDLVVLSNIYETAIRKAPYVMIQHNSFLTTECTVGYKNAKQVVFMSPDHHEHIKAPYKKHTYSAPYVDVDRFKPSNKKRITDYNLYTGLITPHKGLEATIADSDRPIHAYGRTDRPEYLQKLIDTDKLVYKGEYPSEEIHKLYQKYETYFWRLPRYGSYGRNLVEAHLCGMNVNVNYENFGLYKYDWDFEDRESIASRLREELSNFWTRLLDI